MYSRKINRMLRSPAFWVVALLLVAGVASNLAVGQQEEKSQPSNGGAIQAEFSLLREGSRMAQQECHCRVVGEQLLIENADGHAFEALENLAAQRILTALQEDAGNNRWRITGSLTEFQGRNFLYIEHVSRSPLKK